MTIHKDGFPIVSNQTILKFGWSTPDNIDATFESGTLIFDSVNLVAGAGEIDKGRTAITFDIDNPIPWNDDVPEAIKAIFHSPQDALRYSLGQLYESKEHQYRLGIIERPEEEV